MVPKGYKPLPHLLPNELERRKAALIQRLLSSPQQNHNASIQTALANVRRTF